MTKVCTKCKKNKPLEDYYKDARVKDGRASECKSCRNVVQKKYNKSDKGKLRQVKGNAKYAKSTKGKLMQAKARAKYAKSDKGKLALAKYNKSDKGKATIARKNHKRNISISNTLCTLSDKEFNYIVFTAQKNKCACCGRTFNDELKPTRDHIYPVSKGGNFTKETVQALCGSCNSRKGVQTIDYRTEQHIKCICLGGSEI